MLPVCIRTRDGAAIAISLGIFTLTAIDLLASGHAGETPRQGPDLAVTMLRSETDTRPIIVAGGTVTLSIAVNNRRGDSEAHLTTLTVMLPNGIKLKQATPPPSKSEPGNVGTLIWNLGTMAPRSFPRLFQLVRS